MRIQPSQWPSTLPAVGHASLPYSYDSPEGWLRSFAAAKQALPLISRSDAWLLTSMKMPALR